MDLFTHVVFAYLLSFVIWGPAAPQLIAAGAIAGGLPDSDVLVFPLSRRFPILRHHGITHSILGVSIFATAGSFLVPFVLAPFIPGVSTMPSWRTTPFFFLAMEIGGMSHVFLDGFTHFAVPPFIPFSNREFKLEADRAINLGMTVLTVASLVILYEEHGHVAQSLWLETAWVLVAIYGGYLLVRGVGRWMADGVRKQGGYSAVIPTGSPFAWILVDEKITPEAYRIRFRPYTLGRGFTQAERSLSVAKVPGASGPVAGAQAALERSYLPSMAASRFLAESYHFGEAVPKGNGFEVTWYSIEFAMMGRVPGVRAEVDASTGAVRATSAFLRPPAPTGP